MVLKYQGHKKGELKSSPVEFLRTVVDCFTFPQITFNWPHEWQASPRIRLPPSTWQKYRHSCRYYRLQHQ